MGVFDILPGLGGDGGEDETDPPSDSGDTGGEAGDPVRSADLTPADFRERAEALAGRSDVPTLDFTVDSLDPLDELAAGPPSAVDDRVAYGSYLGETIVREYGGEWTDDGGWEVAVALPDDRTTIAVFDAAEMSIAKEPVFAKVAARLEAEGAERTDATDDEAGPDEAANGEEPVPESPAEPDEDDPGARESEGKGEFGSDADTGDQADDLTDGPATSDAAKSREMEAADDASGDGSATTDTGSDRAQPPDRSEEADPVENLDSAGADDEESAGRPGEPATDPDEGSHDGGPDDEGDGDEGDDERSTEDRGDVLPVYEDSVASVSGDKGSVDSVAGDGRATRDVEDDGADDDSETDDDAAHTDGEPDDGADDPAVVGQEAGVEAATGTPDRPVDDGEERDSVGDGDPSAESDFGGEYSPGRYSHDDSGPGAVTDEESEAAADLGVGTDDGVDSTGPSTGGDAGVQGGTDEVVSPDTPGPTDRGQATGGNGADGADDHAAPNRAVLRVAAAELADDWPERDLDHTAASLGRLDAFVRDQWGGRFRRDRLADWTVDHEDSGDPLVQVGAYYGEVLVRSLDGEWVATDDGEGAVAVPDVDGETERVDVFAVARDCLVAPPRFAYHYDALLGRLDVEEPAVSDGRADVFDGERGSLTSGDVITQFAATAESFVEACTHYRLDYSPRSLRYVDDVVDDQAQNADLADVPLADGTDAESLWLTARATAAGAYFATVLLRHRDAQWRIGDGVELVVDRPGGERTVDPVATAADCLRGEDTFVDAYTGLTD